MTRGGADPAEVRLVKLLYGKPRTALDGNTDQPIVELKEAVQKVEKGGLIKRQELRSILDWHAIKCTANDFDAICKRSKEGDENISTKTLFERLSRIQNGSLKVTDRKVTVTQLRQKVEDLLRNKFATIYSAFKKLDTDNSGDISAQEFRKALALYNFVMDDETFEMFCADWMSQSDATKLNVTGNISYEAFKRRFGGMVIDPSKNHFGDVHDKDMRSHLKKLHERDRYTQLRFASAQQVLKELSRLFTSRFASVHEAFSALDTDKSGSIDITEFKFALEKFANLRMKDEEYQNLSRHLRFNLMKPIDFASFGRAFGDLITGHFEKKTMADRNEARLKAHKEKVTNASHQLDYTTADKAAKQFAKKIGNKFDQLRMAFNSMDLDGSGTIESDEFRNVLEGYNLRMTDAEWVKFMKIYAHDKSGKIKRDAFYKQFGPIINGDFGDDVSGQNERKERSRMLAKVNKRQVQATVTAKVATGMLQNMIEHKFDDIRKAFRSFDQDNSGNIEVSEFRKDLKNFNIVMSDAEFSKFLKMHNLSTNQQISFLAFQQKFSNLITGKFEGHLATVTHQASLKEHADKVLARQGMMKVKLDKSMIAKPKIDKLNEEEPSSSPQNVKAKGPGSGVAAAMSGYTATSTATKAENKGSPQKKKKKPSAPKQSKIVRYMSLLDAIARLETLLGPKARKLPAALIAMDLEATSQLKPVEGQRVFAQFGINLTAKDFRQLFKLYDSWEDDGLANYVKLAKCFGAQLEQRVYEVSPMKMKILAKSVEDEKNALKEGQEYLLNKLRNNFEMVMVQMRQADTGSLGHITDDEFVAVLARQGGVRLTKSELAAFMNYYNKPSLRFDVNAKRHIDYKKFSKLFDRLRHPVDFSDPSVKQKFQVQNKQAEIYLRDKLRNAYPKVLRAFKALINDTNNNGKSQVGLTHSAFRRMLTRFGAVRMTNSEWDGFISKYDSNNDGFISFDEFLTLFSDYCERDAKALKEKKTAYTKQVEARKNRRERAREVAQKLIGPAVPVQGAEEVLARHFQNKIGSVAKTFSLLDREGNGMLPRDDFQRACARTGLQLTTREMDALSEKYDPKKKCRVNINDFMTTMRQMISALQANTVNPVIVKRLFKSTQELIAFKYKTSEEAFAIFDANKSGLLEPTEWESVFTTIGLTISHQERTALARFLDLRSDGSGVDPKAFSKLWANLPGTPATELSRSVATWARRSGGKTLEQLMTQLRQAFDMLDGQNERSLPLLELVAALRDAGIKLDNAEPTLQPFRQGNRYNYTLLCNRAKELLSQLFAKWKVKGESDKRPISTRSTHSANVVQARSSNNNSRVRSSHKSNGTRSAKLPQIGRTSPSRKYQNIPLHETPTARSLPQGKRVVLEARLRAAQMGCARSKKSPKRNKQKSSKDDRSDDSATDTDFDTVAFSCWKKLRVMFVAADKNRQRRLPLKTVTSILLRNQVGTRADEIHSRLKPHSDSQGIIYNDFIREILQSRAR
jgi:Ca2+-binding EF-hand superfamily protein